MASDSQTATATTSEKLMEDKVNEEAKLIEKEIVLQETEDVVEDKPVSDLNLTVMKEVQTYQTLAGETENEPPAVESTEKGKDENGEKKLAELVELKEQSLVAEVDSEAVDEEKAEEKQIVESIVEEDNKDKEETKVVGVSESRDEAGSKQVETVDVQLVREVPSETVEDKSKDVEVLEVEPKPEAKVELEGKLEEKAVEIEDSGINLKDSEGDVCSKEDVIEKIITEEKHVLKVPSKAEQKNVSEAKDVVNITEDTETTAAEGKSQETLKETDTEPIEKETEGKKQEESLAEVAEVLEIEHVVEESDEPKQQAEVDVKQKHSNSIMSKVKQSLVKAKKAIIGKSPSSKTITTEETKVKC